MIKVNEFPPIYFLDDYNFPDPYEEYEDGFAAVSYDLDVLRLLRGYSSGFFPWYKDEKNFFHWYVPDERMFLFFDDFKTTKKIKQKHRSDNWQVKYNTNFEAVIKHCANVKRKHESGTWISEEFIEAYTKLHKEGFAFSVESYYKGELVGGFYVVAIGSYVSGESMFYLKSDASKIALYDFILKAKEAGIKYIDCQIPSEHFASWGGKVLSKKEYLPLIRESVKKKTTFLV